MRALKVTKKEGVLYIGIRKQIKYHLFQHGNVSNIDLLQCIDYSSEDEVIQPDLPTLFDAFAHQIINHNAVNKSQCCALTRLAIVKAYIHM